MPTTLTSSEQMELARLLKKVATEDSGFIPDSSYELVHKLVPWPAVEVLVYNDDGRFLLRHRDDLFKGWHIAGGYMKINETIGQACDRHVCKDKMVEGVTGLQLIGTHPWREGEHPFGYPLSLIIACKAVGKVVETDKVKWFNRICPEIIPEHHRFLRYFQKWMIGHGVEIGDGQPRAAIL